MVFSVIPGTTSLAGRRSTHRGSASRIRFTTRALASSMRLAMSAIYLAWSPSTQSVQQTGQPLVAACRGLPLHLDRLGTLIPEGAVEQLQPNVHGLHRFAQ